jgi:Flp pilus assembly protein TadG
MADGQRRRSKTMSIGKRLRIGNQRGVFIVIFALLLLVVLGFVALGIEGGRWYLVRAELAKAVDAAALEAAKNIGGPANVLTLAQEIGSENFPAGYIGTPAAGAGSVRFTATQPAVDTVSVTGNVNATVVLAHLFGITSIPVSATAVAQQRNVEVMMVLDRSGSMAGQKMADLKIAAISFLNYFTPTQAQDMLGLISFSTTVKVDNPLATNFATAMTSAINSMNALGGTNTEDAIDHANGPQSFTNRANVQQYVVFFSDGMPTALTDRFRFNNTDYNAVAVVTGYNNRANCRASDYAESFVSRDLIKPDGSGNYGNAAYLTGDGKNSGGSTCPGGNNTTKWYLFQTRPVPRTAGGVYGAEACNIPHWEGTPYPKPSTVVDDLLPYFCDTAKQLALANAQTLKNRGVVIFVVGLGAPPDIDVNFLTNISSDCNLGVCAPTTNFTYIAPNSSQLQTIFNRIATTIRLRLVQ